MAKIVTLLTDFGPHDVYVAQMKAVILSVNPRATLVDITHGIEKFNIREGAFALASASRFFPKDTVHLAVVDPGVGDARRPIVIKSKHAIYVGPDNGILWLAAHNDGRPIAYEIANRRLLPSRISSTFHGRDVFAYVAARLSKGLQASTVGPKIKASTLSLGECSRTATGVQGRVAYIDSFGNVVTNVPITLLDRRVFSKGKVLQVVSGRARKRVEFTRTYSDVAKGKVLALVGSHGFLEVSVNQGNCAVMLRVKLGDRLQFRSN